jgi:hypothetical protein
MLAYASGTLGLGLAQNLSLLRLNLQWTSYPPHLKVDSLLISAAGLTISLAGSALPFNVIIVVIIVSGVVLSSSPSSSCCHHHHTSVVHPLFKQNNYLSLYM